MPILTGMRPAPLSAPLRAALRIPVLVYFAFTWAAFAGDPRHPTLFQGIDLGIHELGHVLFGFGGDLLAAYGGSLLQCLAPIAAAAMFFRQRDAFAIAFCLGWLGVNGFEVAAYAGDAVAESLPLVTPGGGEPIHDWNFILGALGWLRHTETIAALHRTAAHASFLACFALGGKLVLDDLRRTPPRRAASRSPQKSDPRRGAPEPLSASAQPPARSSAVRRFSDRERNAMAMKMSASESQSLREGSDPPKNAAMTSVDTVPPTSEVSRLTSPANVAVRPWNMKRNTEKNATAPNAMPETNAGGHAGSGFEIAPRKSSRTAPDQPNSDGEL